MYDVAGETSPIFVESDAFLYNLVNPTIVIRRRLWLYDYIVYLRSCGVDYIRSTQNGSDSLMIMSLAVAENIVGA